MFPGTVIETSVYPREQVKKALAPNAAALALAHSHVPGVTEPTRAGEYLTQTLNAPLALVDGQVLDHVVVAGKGRARWRSGAGMGMRAALVGDGEAPHRRSVAPAARDRSPRPSVSAVAQQLQETGLGPWQ